MSKHLFPAPGIEIWKNDKNGFTVFQLHWSADTDPKKAEEVARIKQAMPIRKYMQEYELVWDSFEGLPVYADWDIRVHGVKEEILPELGLPLLVGLDFGLTPAALVCQLQGPCLKVLKEFTAENMGAQRFLNLIGPLLKQKYWQWSSFKRDYITFIDPSGEFRKDTDEGTCAQVVSEYGFENIIPGAIAFEQRRQSVEHFLTRRNKQGPLFQVALPNCPILVQGFQGGYRYSDKVLDSEPSKIRPLKDRYSHIHDALQMVTSKILEQKGNDAIRVPRLQYSWTKDYGNRSETEPIRPYSDDSLSLQR